jgi:hypothetical protein
MCEPFRIKKTETPTNGNNSPQPPTQRLAPGDAKNDNLANLDRERISITQLPRRDVEKFTQAVPLQDWLLRLVTEGYFPYKPSKRGGKQDHVINLVTLNAETGSGRGEGPAANTVLGHSMPEAM